MKTPKSASKLEKAGSALSTPSSGKITKNKSTPMSLKAKVLEKNAKLALLKSQDTINLNGKSPKTPKNFGSPKKGQTPKQSPLPSQNGTAGKKRKSIEGTPVNVGKGANKKSKKSPEVSPEVQLGLKIEKFLESPKDKKPVDSPQPSGKLTKAQKKKQKKIAQSPGGDSAPKPGSQTKSPSPGSPGKKSRRQRQKEAKKRKLEAQKNAQSPGTEAPQGPVADKKKKKLQQKLEAKKLGKKNAQVTGDPSLESPKSGKNKRKNDRKREKRSSESANESRNSLTEKVKASSDAAGAFPNPAYAETAIQAVLDDEKEMKGKKPELLNEPATVMAQVTFFYRPPGRRIQRIILPNSHLHGNPDVIFIAVDMKKAKNNPEESIDFHTNLFKSNGVTSITEIVPMKKIKKEYTQFEEKRKFVNRADVILIDSKIAHRIPSLLPQKFVQKKVPIPVRMTADPGQLKKEISIALKKTPVLLKENSLKASIRIGHADMKKTELVENLTAVAAALCNEKRFPGGKPNILNISVKTQKSDYYPVYISCVPRSKIQPPKAPVRKEKEIVEGEVSTAGVTVAVHPSGKVEIKSKDVDLDETEHDTSPKKKKKIEASSDDSDDEEMDDSDLDDADSDGDLDPAEVEKFMKANKAEDDDEEDDEDDSEEEGGGVEKAEQEFLLQLRKQQDAIEADAQKAQKGKKSVNKAAPADDDDESDSEGGEEDLDEEEDELDEEDESDEESDNSEIPKLVPAKVQPQKGKGGKPGNQAKGKPGMAQKGKPNASQKRGSFQKTKDSPKAKKR